MALDPSTARKGVVSSVLNKLREIIRKAVNNVMKRRVDSENYDDMSEEALIVLVNFEIESGIVIKALAREMKTLKKKIYSSFNKNKLFN